MAEKDPQVHPTEPPTDQPQPKTDLESSPGAPQPSSSDEHCRRNKRMKCLAYVTLSAIFLTVIILAFALTIMHVKNPKFRIASVEVGALSFSSSAEQPSFSLTLDAELAIKNPNFGHYSYESSNITLAYRGTEVGKASISGGRAKSRSTKVVEISVGVSSRNVSGDGSNLAGDLSSGILSLTGYGDMRGKVHLLEVFKKTKTPRMNCTINIELANKEIQDWNCS